MDKDADSNSAEQGRGFIECCGEGKEQPLIKWPAGRWEEEEKL